MRQDRFLIGILAGIGLLVVLSLAVFFIRNDAATYGPEDSPEGVLHNYVLALQNRDYERAYTFLSGFAGKPDLSRFRQAFTDYQKREVSQTGVEMTSTSLSHDGQSAQVSLALLHGGSGLFDEGYRENNSATLVLENGVWKVASVAYPFWSYEWSQPESFPIPQAQPTPGD
jgi:hypothetical protein